MSDLGSDAPWRITREVLLEIGGWRAMKEGLALWESGMVGAVVYAPPLLSGEVRTGTGSVKARLYLGRRLSEVENLCSCRQAREYGTICPHVMALGLEWLNPRSRRHPASPPVAGDADARQRPAPDLRYVPLSEMPDGAKPLRLSIILPPKFSEAWHTGEIHVACEATVDQSPPLPLTNFLRPERPTYAVEDCDAQVFDAMRRITGGGLHGLWTLTAKKFAEFFLSLVDHPRITLGRASTLEITRAVPRTRLELRLRDDGGLNIHAAEDVTASGVILQSTYGQWRFDGQRLVYLNGLPVSYLSLRGKDLTVPREQLARFFQYEVPMLERQANVVMDAGCDRLEFRAIKPRVEVTLDGLLSGLSCKVVVAYGDGKFVLQGNHAVDTDQEAWRPDPDDALRYFIRDRQAERALVAQILGAGFLPGQRQPEWYTLTGEGRVGFFLANVLPKWCAEWAVSFTPRLHDLIEKCDRIEPEVTVSASGEDWLSVGIDFREARGQSSLSHAEVQRLLNIGVSHQRMTNGRIALLPTQSVHEFQEVIRDCQARQSGGGGPLRIDARYAAYLANTLAANNWHLTSRSRWQPPRALTEFAEVPLPAELARLARPYQRTGVNWLHHLMRNSMSGILADEMGLGKTFQTLAYLAYRRQHGPDDPPALIVAPTTLVLNWLDEARRFTPRLRVLTISGAKRKPLFEKITGHDLVITSYALLRRDIDVYKELEFSVAVLDEAQYIKNQASQNSACAKMLRANNRFVLTGTPIENSLLDLWSIFDFLMPGYLGGAADFTRRYALPITKQNDRPAQNRLRERVRPFILRRTKAEVARDLPEKLEQIVFCELTGEQKAVYQRLLEQGRRNLMDSGDAGGPGRGRMAVLTALMRLRQVCCHLALLPTGEAREWKEPSAKLEYFFELFNQALDGGHRVLVFSQFVSMLKLLRAQLDARALRYCYLDGGTVDRGGEIGKFQGDAGIPLFLISLKAGGTGINLTGADTVVHFDPWWNPAVEDQATARAHRIGQDKIVNSYKLIARGTVEEKIINLQKKKTDLIANTLMSEEGFIHSLSWAELQSLLE
ncbi:MAG: DEAD/DEAH box helicase [Verrucomicrobiales bacterium]|jgi:superfamily II DNA or RNA helicase|nr:DEAD/DEAH box helicase [Verrucomicrobiales bacterium]